MNWLTQLFRSALPGLRRRKSRYCCVTNAPGSAKGPPPLLLLKLAVTLRALAMLTLQLPVPLQAPPQPAKLLPDAGCAVKVTCVPAA